MAGGQVRVDGARQLRKTLRRASGDLGELKAAHGDVGRIVDADARFRAPRKSGTLARTVRSSGTTTAAIVRAGYQSVPYGPPVHWGTGPRTGQPGPHNIPANPFVSQAAQRTEPRWVLIYKKAVDRILARIKGA